MAELWCLSLRPEDARQQTQSCPPPIGTLFTDARATVVLGSYESVILNEVGMNMEMMGPGDIIVTVL